MTVKQLKSILHEVPENTEVKMLSCSDDNVNYNYDVGDIVHVKPHVGEKYNEELVLIPV